MATPQIGEKWDSDKMTQRFNVISGPEAHNGFGEWANAQFVGHKAKRTTDGKLALVGLTKKPAGYPYDFVLL